MNFLEKIEEEFQAVENTNYSSIRKPAFDAFRKIGIPSSRHEEWKYTNVKSKLGESLSLLIEDSEVNGAVKNYIASLPPYAFRLIFLNGVFHPELSIVPDIKGFSFVNLKEALSASSPLVDKYFDKLIDKKQEHFAALNTAFVNDGALIHVSKNVVITDPIYIQYFFTASDSKPFVQTRNLVVLEDGASLQLAEDFRNASNIPVQYNHVSEMYVGKNAKLDVVKLQLGVSNAIGIHTLESQVERDGNFSAASITFSSPDSGTGKSMIRNNVTARLIGENSHADLNGLYFGKEDAHIDNHILVDHTVPNCTSNQLYKGVLNGDSTGVFNGKVFVKPDAQKTNAFQSSKALLLSDNASVYSKPQLEIFADDVKCSHGVAIGQLDENALFYLQARGISKPEAVQLLTYAFAHEAVECIKIQPVRQFICDKLKEELKLTF